MQRFKSESRLSLRSLTLCIGFLHTKSADWNLMYLKIMFLWHKENGLNWSRLFNEKHMDNHKHDMKAPIFLSISNISINKNMMFYQSIFLIGSNGYYSKKVKKRCNGNKNIGMMIFLNNKKNGTNKMNSGF